LVKIPSISQQGPPLVSKALALVVPGIHLCSAGLRPPRARDCSAPPQLQPLASSNSSSRRQPSQACLLKCSRLKNYNRRLIAGFNNNGSAPLFGNTASAGFAQPNKPAFGGFNPSTQSTSLFGSQPAATTAISGTSLFSGQSAGLFGSPSGR
jgi:hypothetical protein